MHKLTVVSVFVMTAIGSTAMADDINDFGLFRDHELSAASNKLFGIKKPLKSASTASIDAATAEAHPTFLVSTAKSLHTQVVSADAELGANIDMMALWPNDVNPTHLIVCNEQGTDKPGVQRVSLDDGSVDTILTGTRSCDPAHVTPWGTVIVAEEHSDGSMLEIIDPLHTTGVSYDRVAHRLLGTDAGNVSYRPAVGHLAFEGVGVYPNGVMYYGDENRPSQGTGGGAYFKFVPSNPWTPGDAPITDLIDSPLANGQVFGLRLGKRSGGTDYGQGSELGKGAWVDLGSTYDADLRAAATSYGLTGYYRPEDLNADLKAMAEGKVRFCSNNTGNEEDDRNWGNTICITDGTIDEAGANTATPEVQMFVVGNPTISMMDNIAYQPGRGNWVIHEDRDAVGMSGDGYPFNNSIHLCLEDGVDVDDQSDGCVRIVTFNDLNAESTGGLFDAYGQNYYFSVQHNVTGHGVILKLTGWR